MGSQTECLHPLGVQNGGWRGAESIQFPVQNCEFVQFFFGVWLTKKFLVWTVEKVGNSCPKEKEIRTNITNYPHNINYNISIFYHMKVQ